MKGKNNMSLQCKNLPALEAFLEGKGAVSRPIDYGKQFSLPSGLLVNVFDKGTVTFQNHADKSVEVSEIEKFINKL